MMIVSEKACEQNDVQRGKDIPALLVGQGELAIEPTPPTVQCRGVLRAKVVVATRAAAYAAGFCIASLREELSLRQLAILTAAELVNGCGNSLTLQQVSGSKIGPGIGVENSGGLFFDSEFASNSDDTSYNASDNDDGGGILDDGSTNLSETVAQLQLASSRDTQASNKAVLEARSGLSVIDPSLFESSASLQDSAYKPSLLPRSGFDFSTEGGMSSTRSRCDNLLRSGSDSASPLSPTVPNSTVTVKNYTEGSESGVVVEIHLPDHDSVDDVPIHIERGKLCSPNLLNVNLPFFVDPDTLTYTFDPSTHILSAKLKARPRKKRPTFLRFPWSPLR